ncbi:J-type co-chaperone JAC1 [Nannizzia gypsea CBS 118893]|uniref:J-type co-chaperone JAC1 n=1 Tax=Arthroderma gypseum (strain ATCC MYA-4604 / CBS 118893) TaxID=535722 RepID=E4UYC4_ARTGP|nr:J-type co-chaperone JAC1 [Nannizzia gypsea CBS 118893]EFR02087.1 J-type co-chaperone JAC1 [Nannizzia gypsea CBS 118893]
MHKKIPSSAVFRLIGPTPALRPVNPTVRRTAQGSNEQCLLCQSGLYRRPPSSQSRQFNTSRSLSFKSPIPRAASQQADPASQPIPEDLPSGLTAKIPDITTHYTIFPKTLPDGPPPNGSFDISLPELRREFLSLQGFAHPDKFPDGPAKRKAEALSSRINEAYRALGDPLARAQYLLASQHDIDVTAEDGANKHPQSPETLMQVMEVQEAVEEAEDENIIADLKVENEERILQTVNEMGQAFESGDIDSATMLCSKLKFWYTIRDGLREWEPGSKSVRLVH